MFSCGRLLPPHDRVLTSVARTLLIFLMVVPASIASMPAQEENPEESSEKYIRTMDRTLGAGHLWLKANQVFFDSEVDRLWGLDNETYLGLEAFWGDSGNFYVGFEIGRIAVGTADSGEGERFEDLDFTNVEINAKTLFDLTRGFSFGFGGGFGGFWVDGEEVHLSGRSELADFGYGFQVFIELNWRVRRFVIGVDSKYQSVIDILELDYSNLRLGGHIGVVF